MITRIADIAEYLFSDKLFRMKYLLLLLLFFTSIAKAQVIPVGMAQSGFAVGAALTCSNYSVTVDGVAYDDWYLPSIDELKLMYKTNNKNKFSITYYWSSSEYSISSSWVLCNNDCTPGTTELGSKDIQLFVRAARSF